VPGSGPSAPPPVRPVALLHQEGILGLLALVGLALRPGGPARWLAPHGAVATTLIIGVAAAAGASAVLWLLRRLPAVADLERFQRALVHGWTLTDAAAVALLSGLVEEALVRALLQPLVGLVPAALIFALLHLVPRRDLWLWPVLAFVLGLGLGALYDVGGYPAAAAAHVTINLVALSRLRREGGSGCVQ